MDQHGNALFEIEKLLKKKITEALNVLLLNIKYFFRWISAVNKNSKEFFLSSHCCEIIKVIASMCNISIENECQIGLIKSDGH